MSCDALEELLGRLAISDRRDVRVTCGHRTFLLHSTLLAAKSTFFATALDIPMAESRSRRVVVRDVELGVFQKILWFVYSGQLSFEASADLEELLEAADRFDMEELKAALAEAMEQELEADTVATVAQLAGRHHARELLEACAAYIQRHDVSLGEEEVRESPGLAVAVMASYREVRLGTTRE